MHRRPPLRLLFVIALGVLVGASAAWAGEDGRVAVLDFDGKDAKRFEREVREIVRARARLVREARYRRTARRLRARSMRERHVARVASRLELDAVVRGFMVKRKGKRYLRIHVREGADGEIIDRFMVRARRRPLGTKARRALGERLGRAVDDAIDYAHEERLIESRQARRTKKRRTKKRRTANVKRRKKARRTASAKRRTKKRRTASAKRRTKKRRTASARRRATKREERRMAARAKARYDDSGQAIDEEVPPGL